MSLPAKVASESPKQRALALRRAQARLEKQAGMRAGAVIAVWMAISIALGIVIGAGELVHAVWLAIVSVATVASPAAIVLLRRVNEDLKAGRLALVEAEPDMEQPEHLDRVLASFHADTRVARIGVSDAVEPGEGVRLLWDWRRSFESLTSEDRERLEQLGVGLGPIALMLDRLDHAGGALDDDQLRDAQTHLVHVERLLGDRRDRLYR